MSSDPRAPVHAHKSRQRQSRWGAIAGAGALLAVLTVVPVVADAAAPPARVPTAQPSSSPTDSPTETPTGTPTQTPTDTPTDTPTGTPTGTPTSPPPTSPPPTSAPPTTVPPTSGSPTSTPPGTPVVPAAPEIDEESTAAFALATTQLRVATDALDTAKAKLSNPSLISMAIGHARRADSDVETATQRVSAVAAELAHERADLVTANYAIGGDARSAYVDGPSAGLSTLLASDGPADLANRMGTIDAVGRSSSHAVAQLDAVQSRVAGLEHGLSDVQAALAAAVDIRDGLVAQADTMAAEAATAQNSLPGLQKAVDAAVAQAKAAIPADQALAAQQSAESDQLATSIIAASQQLEDDGQVVSGTGVFVRPATGPITSPYGLRMHPILGYVKMHTGVDFAGDDGVVYAADDGVVILTVWSTAYGNVTVIDHGRSGGQFLATFYAHQAAYFVHVGDAVHKGEAIGAVGETGLATGPHLHFEVRLNGVPVDPMPFLPPE